MWCSTDNGGTWESFPSDPTFTEYRFWRGDAGDFFAYAEVWGIPGAGKQIRHYSSDGTYQGNVYQDVYYVLDFGVAPSGDYLMVVDQYFDPNTPWLNKPRRVMRRSLSDPTWYEFPLVGTFYSVVGVARSPSGKGPMLYVGANGVWRSSDNGTTWTVKSTGLSVTNPAIRKLAVAPDGTLFAFGNGGELFCTKNDGDIWMNASSGLPVAGTLADIAFDALGHAYVADANGVYKSTEIFTGVQVDDAREMPKRYVLAQNFPNPFNPTTVINYELPVVSEVKLIVYDILGRQKAVLVDDRKGPGRYEERFDASDLASGVYFYRIQAGSFSQTRKLLLLR
jgi:hypothetical protein